MNGEHTHPSAAHRAACPVCNPNKTVPQLNDDYRTEDHLSSTLCPHCKGMGRIPAREGRAYAPGELVSYLAPDRGYYGYDCQPIPAEVLCMSKSGRKARIKFQSKSRLSAGTVIIYVNPAKLEPRI